MSQDIIVVGIDLAGSPNRNTGICLLQNKRIVDCKILFTDDRILDFVKSSNARIVAMDAPLSLPPGRKSLEDNNGIHLRDCDRELLKRKIRFFPITLGPMRMLTKRGIALKRKFKRLGLNSIEIFPGGSQDVLGIPRKQHSMTGLRKGLENLGIKGLRNDMNGDELDAVTGAYTAYLYLKGKADILGTPEKSAIILPKKV